MLSLFYTTYPNMEIAQKIVETLLQEKLIACANIFEKVNSFYLWQGKICSDEEVVGILKAPSVNKGDLTQKINEIHPYEVPCIVELPTSSVNDSYEQWLMNSCAYQQEK